KFVKLLKLPDGEQEKIEVPRKLFAILNVHNLKFLQSSTPKIGQEQKTRFLTKVTANSVRLVRLSAKEVVQWHSLAGSSENIATTNATQMMQGNIWEILNICGLAQSMVTDSNSNRHPRSLQGNMHSGKIPEVIGLMQAITVLDLSEHKLVGPIPPIIGNLYYTGKLYLQGNSLTGPISTELGNMAKLSYL
ncbi:hypothetical protein GIB67_009921, partial [Kingdonia uniflora]